MICTLTFILSFQLSVSFAKSDKWTGVDESVVEKYAEEHGRKAWTPFINTDQGDLLLFVFLIAGAAGGFVAGYSWKKLMDLKQPDTKKDDTKADALPH
ncbi:cobalt transporter [Candidatus Magnetomonas plexicatena]|nr:cobalt transporter [Nitrospirales bacterium LBB_01]